MLWKYKKCYEHTNEDVPVEPTQCYLFTLRATTETDINFTFNDCTRGEIDLTVSGNTEVDVCAISVDMPANSPTQWEIFIGIECSE